MDDERALATILNMQEVLNRYGIIGVGIEEMRDYVATRLNKATELEDKLESMDAEIQKLEDEVTIHRYDKERLAEENKKLKEQCQRLQTIPPQQEYDYRVIRTFDHSSNATKDLDEYFKAGYEFVHASEFVRGEFSGNNYIEYIVRKKRQQV